MFALGYICIVLQYVVHKIGFTLEGGQACHTRQLVTMLA